MNDLERFRLQTSFVIKSVTAEEFRRYAKTFRAHMQDTKGIENVKVLAVNRRWRAIIDGICDKARELGYDVSLNVLNAADYGVPQARERMILIGTRQGVCPKPDKDKTRRTVRDALDALPRLGSPGNDRPCKARITPAAHPVLRPPLGRACCSTVRAAP